MNELIEKLKDKKYVRAFGLMSEEEQKVYRKVGGKNCEVLAEMGKPRIVVWHNCKHEGHSDFHALALTYAIKPDYQPEPEFVDLEIVREYGVNCGMFGVTRHKPIITSSFQYLSMLPNLPDFECFYVVAKDLRPNLNVDISLCEVAKHISEGKKVYARFRSDK